MDIFGPKTPQFLLAAAALIAVLTGGYYFIRQLRAGLDDDGCPAPDEVYNPLRDAYERGSMGSEEFERVQALLGGPPEPSGLEAELKAALKRKEEAERRRAAQAAENEQKSTEDA